MTVLIIAAQYSRSPYLLHSLYTFGNMEKARGGALNSEIGYPDMLPPSDRKNTCTDQLTSYHIYEWPFLKQTT